MADKNLNSLNFGTGDTYYINAGNVKYDPNETFASGTVGAKFDEQSSRIATKAEKTALASTDREVALIRRAIDGQLMEIEEDHTEAYSKALPSGVIGVGVNMIGGKSIIMNQLVVLDAPTRTYNGITKTKNSDGTYTFNGTCTEGFSDLFDVYANEIRVNAGDIVYATFTANKSLPEGANVRLYISGSIATQSVTISENGNIITLNQTAKTSLCLRINEGSVLDNLTITVKLINLTKAFGATKAAAMALADCRTWFPKPTYTASEGYVLSADCDEVVSEGFNIWNEEWEAGGINDTTGAKETVNSQFRTKNYIKVNPSTAYYFYSGTGYLWAYSYDINKNFIGRLVGSENNIANTIQTTQSGCEYILFKSRNEDNVPQYRNNICINLSNASLNGQYLPYMTDGFNIPQGLRQAHPLRSAGDVHDEYNIERKYTKVVVGKINIADLDCVKFGTNKFYKVYNNSFDIKPPAAGLKPNILTRLYTPVAYGLWGNMRLFIQYNRTLYIENDEYDDAASFNAAMANEEMLYERDEPIYYYDPTSPELAVNGGTVVPDATHIVDDESYFPTTSNLLNAEAGGSITFKQTSTEFQLPNSTDYFVKTSPSVA